MNPILECQGLSKQYKNFYALNNLNLSLEKGQIVGLLGPNGSGKSTLIKLINDILIPTQGKVLINGMEPCIETKKIVSYLPERTYLDESMRVRDILTFFSDFYEDFQKERADQMLADLDINIEARLKTYQKGPKKKYSSFWS